MGHYYSEMRGDKCAHPPTQSATYNDEHFLIDGLQIKTVKQFKDTYGWTTIYGQKIKALSWENGIYNKTLYEDRAEAEKVLLAKVQHQILETQDILESLKEKARLLSNSPNK